MEIRGTDNVEFNHPQREPREANGDYKPCKISPRDGSDKSGVSRSESAPYIRRAAEAPDLDARAIAEAKRLLAEGKLEDYQAALDAAGKIVQRGL